MVPGIKNPKIIVDDNEYLINRKTCLGKTMWLCGQYHKLKCKSRIITFGKTVKITSKHNHPPVRPDLSNSVMQWFHIIRST